MTAVAEVTNSRPDLGARIRQAQRPLVLWVTLALLLVLILVPLCMLIYGSLSVATYMAKKRRKTMAAFFAIGFVSVIYGASYISMENFEPQPSYPTVLQPYLDRWITADTLDHFMTDNTALFEAETLAEDNVNTP